MKRLKVNFFIGFLLSFLCYNLQAQSEERITELYGQKDYEGVISLGKKVLEEQPESPYFNFLVGRALFETNKKSEAIEYLEKAKKDQRDWVRAWSHAVLGTAYYIDDNYQLSKENLKAAIQLNGTRHATNHAKWWLKALQMDSFYDFWELHEGKFIRFHFQDKNSVEDVEWFIRSREAAYEEINKFFESKPYKKIDFYVWANNEEAREVLGQPLGFSLVEPVIINSRADQSKGHEIAHILAHHGVFPTTTTKLINEGVAVFFDLNRVNRLEMAKKTLNDAEVKILDLWNNDERFPVDCYYAVGGAWIEYLQKNGTEEQLKQLLKVQTAEEAKKIYPNFDKLVKEFDESLRG